jgi:hypothetical protein
MGFKWQILRNAVFGDKIPKSTLGTDNDAQRRRDVASAIDQRLSRGLLISPMFPPLPRKNAESTSQKKDVDADASFGEGPVHAGIPVRNRGRGAVFQASFAVAVSTSGWMEYPRPD